MTSLTYATLSALKEAGFAQEKRDGVLLEAEGKRYYQPTVEELYYDLDRVTKRFKIQNDHNEIGVGIEKLDGTIEHIRGGQLLEVLAAAWLAAVAKTFI